MNDGKNLRPSMVSIWLGLAQTLSRRSTCERLKTGCVITDKALERVYSVGYNGGAKGLPHACRKEDEGNCGDIHAEVNAHAKLGERDTEKVYFLTTIPCETCAKLIINSGASKVYVANKEYRSKLGLEILGLAEIPVEEI